MIPRIDAEISRSVLKKFPLQCTALEDRQISLAFFSDLVDEDEKASMAARLLAIDQPELEPILPSAPDLSEKQLRAFIGPQSWFLFQLIGIDSDWLRLDPRTWPDDPRFVATNAIVRALPATNDASERGCRLATDYKVMNSVHQTHNHPRFLQSSVVLIKSRRFILRISVQKTRRKEEGCFGE